MSDFLKNDFLLPTIAILVASLTSFISAFITTISHKYSNKLSQKVSEDKIIKSIDKVKEKDEGIDVIGLMLNNVRELREYYLISKSHANVSFVITIIACMLGFLLYCIGFVLNYIFSLDVIIYSTFAGTVIEIISALFFWIYRQSITQLNLYHERLSATEKYLTAIQLVENFSETSKKDDAYRYVLEVILIDNSSKERKVSKNE